MTVAGRLDARPLNAPAKARVHSQRPAPKRTVRLIAASRTPGSADDGANLCCAVRLRCNRALRHPVVNRRQRMSTQIPPFAVQAGEGIVLRTPTGDTAVIKVDTKQTDGSLTVIEFVVGPKQGPALHKHHHEDELWFVLDGQFRFKAGDAILRASTGGMAFGPRGVPHCFENIGQETGRLLVVTTPSGLEQNGHETDPRPDPRPAEAFAGRRPSDTAAIPLPTWHPPRSCCCRDRRSRLRRCGACVG